jgi:hypothetical protein
MIIRILHAVVAVLLLVTGAQAALTTIELTDAVLVSNTLRFGVNLGGDTYYSGTAYMKQRDMVNFEGTSYRQCHLGTLFEDGFATEWSTTNGMVLNGWNPLLISGGYVIISGPAYGTTGIIAGISSRFIRLYNNVSNTQPFFVFDNPITLPGHTPIEDAGLLVEQLAVNQGSIQRAPTYWLSTNNCFLQQGDVPPGSFGYTACRMNGASGDAIMRMSTSYQRYANNNGVWTSAFWAKKVSGAPTLKVAIESSSYGGSVTITPTTDWQKYEVALTISGVPETSAHPLFKYTVQGGVALADDFAVWKIGEQNPTDFRDDFIAILTNYNPGILRNLQMGGNTVSNTIQPPLHSYACMNAVYDKVGPTVSHDLQSYGIHQFYTLCEYIGAEPWFTLPGTMRAEEMSQFMEYLGGPSNVGMGALRAALGHPAPWTKTLRRIHVEFGNEAWNTALGFLAGGYNGPNYWSNFIEIAKASLYYTNSVLLYTAGQNFSSSMARDILRNAPRSDRYAIAPYILHALYNNDLLINDTQDKLFRWLFAYPLQTTFVDGMPQQYGVMTNTGVEFAVYEVNHHITGGNAPLGVVNTITPSLGAGVSVANTMLALLKTYKMRNQCFFTLVQESFNSSDLGGDVKLWGGVLSLRQDRPQWRPTGLAQLVVNKALGGDLVATRHGGDNPTFTATGSFSGFNDPQTVTYPVLHSYAFRDGMRRALILCSLDVATAQPVTLRLPEKPLGLTAQSWLLTSNSITNNNENAGAPTNVVVHQLTHAAFADGYALLVPPFSLQAFVWNVALQCVSSSNALRMTEGGTTQFQVKLNAAPTADVWVTVARVAGDEHVLVNTNILFTPAAWAGWRPVTVTALADSDTTTGVALVRCSSPSLSETTDIPVTVDDLNELRVRVTTNAVTIREGSNAMFSVALNIAPAHDITVNVSRIAGDTNIAVTSGDTLVFAPTNGSVWQPVTLNAAPDTDPFPASATIRCAAPEALPADVAVSVAETELVSVTFQQGSAGYTGTRDTYLASGSSSNNNYGTATTMYLRSGYNHSLIAWDLSSVPSSAVVQSVTLSFYVNTAVAGGATNVFLYESTRPWTELGATWARWNNTVSTGMWSAAGGAGVSDMRFAPLGTFSLAATGMRTCALNADGIAAVQQWLREPAVNNGFMLINNSEGTAAQLRTRDYGTAADRPSITITYYLGDPPQPPQNPSIVINDGAAMTLDTNVLLRLFAENPTPVVMQIAEQSDFAGAAWLAYATNRIFTLSPPLGIKTVYARFSDGGFGISATVNDSIELVPEPLVGLMAVLAITLRRATIR